MIVFVVLLAVGSSLVSAQNDQIVFPGPTHRPEKFPLTRPTRPTLAANPNPAPVVPTFTSQVPDSIPQAPNPRPQVLSTASPPDTATPAVAASTPNIEAYNQCVDNCIVTSEYNPVCASDGSVYSNPGKLNCARNCGNPVELVKYGQCEESNRG